MTDKRVSGWIESLLRARLKDKLDGIEAKTPLPPGEGIAYGSDPTVPEVPTIPGNIAFLFAGVNAETFIRVPSALIMRNSAGQWVKLDHVKVAAYWGVPTFNDVPSGTDAWVSSDNSTALMKVGLEIWEGPGISYDVSANMNLFTLDAYCKIGTTYIVAGKVAGTGALVVRFSSDPLVDQYNYRPGYSPDIYAGAFNTDGTQLVIASSSDTSDRMIHRLNVSLTGLTDNGSTKMCRVLYDPSGVTMTQVDSGETGGLGIHQTTCLEWSPSGLVCYLTLEEHLANSQHNWTSNEGNLFVSTHTDIERFIDVGYCGNLEVMASEFLNGSNLITIDWSRTQDAPACSWTWAEGEPSNPLGPASMWDSNLNQCVDREYGCTWLKTTNQTSITQAGTLSFKLGGVDVGTYFANPSSTLPTWIPLVEIHYETTFGWYISCTGATGGEIINAAWPVEVRREQVCDANIAITMSGDRNADNSPPNDITVNLTIDGVKTPLTTHTLYNGLDVNTLLDWERNTTWMQVDLDALVGGFSGPTKDRLWSTRLNIKGNTATGFDNIIYESYSGMIDGDLNVITGNDYTNVYLDFQRYMLIDADQADLLV